LPRAVAKCHERGRRTKPLAKERLASVRPTAARDLLPSRRDEVRVKLHVLVVDDDEAVRSAVADVLAEEGFEVALAQDGQQALATLRRDPPPALVLLDLMMPHVSGWEVMEAMRATAALAGIPIMLLTAFGSHVGLPRGCHVLHKPFERDLLVSEVRAAAATRASR
jgi:DNA-binding response OmpR family regulator